jgi:hypothetical protein
VSLQLAQNLTEGKSFGGRRTFANDKAILMSTLVRLIGSLRANLDRKMISQAVRDYASLKEEFRNSLFGILESYQQGEITAEVMESMWRSEIRETWEKAYGLGIRSVGNPFGIWEEDRSWLKGAESDEFGYLGKFVEDIKNNELTMSTEERLGMYVKTLDGVFFHGKVDGSPEFVQIYWDLKEARHCSDCIKYAGGSPYTQKTLPAVPRDGTSRCLSNCRCELRFEYAEEKPKPEMYVIKGPKPMVPPEGYRLPSDKESDKLGAMYAEIERLRGLIQATKGEVKKELIRQRRDVNAAMIDFMEKHKIYYVPMGQVQKTKFVESIADQVKKELLLEGGPGSGYWGHKGRPGRRGGSVPGGGISAHTTGIEKRVYSRAMALKLRSKGITSASDALAYLRQKYPGQPEGRYQRALSKAGISGAMRDVTGKTEVQLKVAKDLGNGAISNVKALGGGVTPTYVLDVDRRKGVFKTMSNRARKEVAAYEFDKMIGFGIVPPVVYRDVDLGDGKEPQKGSIMHFVEGEIGSKHIQKGGKFRYLDMAKITAFDFIIGNQDRHPGNYVVDKNGKTWAIDNALTFWKSDKIVSSTIPMVEDRPIPAVVKAAVKRLLSNRNVLERKLASMMSDRSFAKKTFDRASELANMKHFPKERFEWHKPWTEKHGYTPERVKGLAEGLKWLQRLFSTSTTLGKTRMLQ